MFEVPGSDVKSVHIDDDCVKGTASPKYIRNNSSLDESDVPTNDSSNAATTPAVNYEEETQVRVQQ